MKRILIVEDDAALTKGLEQSFKEEGYDVVTAKDGEKGFQLARKESVSLIILDLLLPLKDGIDVCKDLRKEGVETPILMLTSKREETDKVIGLEIGADDYVTKPFSIRELHARVKALLRRRIQKKEEVDEYSFGDIHVDFKKHEARKKNKTLRLSSREFAVLRFFVRHEGEVVTREMLLDEVWGYENFPTTRTVDNYILTIRKKIEETPSKPRHLLTVHTTGYKFVK